MKFISISEAMKKGSGKVALCVAGFIVKEEATSLSFLF